MEKSRIICRACGASNTRSDCPKCYKRRKVRKRLAMKEEAIALRVSLGWYLGAAAGHPAAKPKTRFGVGVYR